jgi:hypothetical protein
MLPYPQRFHSFLGKWESFVIAANVGVNSPNAPVLRFGLP